MEAPLKKSAVKDMTSGSPLKLIMLFAVPMMLGNIIQQLYNSVDAIIVGKFVSTDAFAAVGSTGSFSFLILGFITGMTAGFQIPISNAFGAKDYRKMRVLIFNSAAVGIILTAVMTLIACALCVPLLKLLNTPEEIFDDSFNYIFVIFAGLFSVFIYNFAASVLRAVGNSKIPLLFLLMSSLLNVILDLLFVLVFKMGVTGAAVATVISQAVSGVCCIIYIFKKLPFLIAGGVERKIKKPYVLKTLSMGLPMGFQFSITAIGSLILQWGVNGFGTNAVAAYTAYVKLINLIFPFMECMGIASGTFCSQNLGAIRFDRIKKGISAALLLNLTYGVIAGVLFAFFGWYGSFLFISKDDTAVLPYVKNICFYCGMLLPFLATLFLFRNTVQSLGFAFPAMFTGAMEIVGRLIMVILAVGFKSYVFISLASPLAWIFADLYLIPVYLRSVKILKSRFDTAKPPQTLANIHAN